MNNNLNISQINVLYIILPMQNRYHSITRRKNGDFVKKKKKKKKNSVSSLENKISWKAIFRIIRGFFSGLDLILIIRIITAQK